MAPSKGAVCSAVNCNNNQRKIPNLSFFRFPKDPERGPPCHTDQQVNQLVEERCIKQLNCTLNYNVNEILSSRAPILKMHKSKKSEIRCHIYEVIMSNVVVMCEQYV